MVFFFLVWILGLFGFFSPAFADSYYIRDTFLGQSREDLQDRREFPNHNYLEGRYQHLKWRADTNLQIYRDWERRKEDFDLFENSIHGQLLQDRLELTAGRQFFTPGFNTFLMDGVSLDLLATEKLGVDFYGGTPRYPETGDFKQDDDLLSGLRVFLRNMGGIAGNISTLYRRENFSQGDWIENDQLSLAGYFVYDGKRAEQLRPYLGLEYQVSGKVLNLMNGGFNWMPKRPLSFNLEFNLFDENRQEARKTLTAFHTEDHIVQGRFGGSQKINRDFSLFENYSLTHLKNTADRWRNSHQVEAGLDWFFWPAGLRITPAYAFTQSFGGKVHRASLGVEKTFNRIISLTLSNHYAQFTKITHDNGKAFSSLVWLGWHATPQWTLGVHVESLKNNDVTRETRGGFLVQWGLGTQPMFPTVAKGVLLL